jgi:hypothetical protein
MTCFKTSAAILALVALACLASAADDKEGEGKGKKGAVLRGPVKAVDPTKGTLTLAVREGNDDVEDAPLVDKTFPVAKDARITVDGKEAKLGDLKAGSQAIVNLSADRKTVTRITVGKGKGGDNEGEKSQPKPEEKGKG